ncbi:MAG: hypothetical protein AAB546_03745 [Patescibacteria group bacterium]
MIEVITGEGFGDGWVLLPDNPEEPSKDTWVYLPDYGKSPKKGSIPNLVDPKRLSPPYNGEPEEPATHP